MSGAEGFQFTAENSADDEKEEKRKAQIKKPENLGILAVETPEEPKPSPLEKVIAALREPAPEADKKPAAEEEPVVLPETEPPIERVPEEDARRIVQEMVAVEQPAEDEPEEEPEPEVESEVTPEAAPAETLEPAPVVVAEAEPVEAAEVIKEKTDTEPETIEHAEPAPAPIPKVEAAPEPEEPPEPEVEAEPAPEPEIEKPEPVDATIEKPAEEEEKEKKPGFIRSLFKRRERKEPEPEEETAPEPTPEPESEKPKPEPEAEAETAPEEPEFKFKEKTEEPVGKPKAEEVPEELESAPKQEANPERIGQMLLNTETVMVEEQKPAPEAVIASQEAEEKQKVEASPIEPVSGKRIDTMSRGELMDLAATITIEGNNLRHMYETHLIGERGLRRLMAEHINGGDLPKALRREVLEHEMDFERDPVMRDIAPLAATPIDSNNSVLDQLLQKADVTMSGQGEQTAFSKASAKYEKAGARQRRSRQYRVLDIVLVATISTLTLLVILVLLGRG